MSFFKVLYFCLMREREREKKKGVKGLGNEKFREDFLIFPKN